MYVVEWSLHYEFSSSGFQIGFSLFLDVGPVFCAVVSCCVCVWEWVCVCVCVCVWGGGGGGGVY